MNRAPYLSCAQIDAEIASIEVMSRQRPLGPGESARLENLVMRRRLRGYRLRDQLARARARVAAIEAEMAHG